MIETNLRHKQAIADDKVQREKQRTISKNCRFTPSEISLITEAVDKADVSFSNLLRKSVLMVAAEIIQRKIAP